MGKGGKQVTTGEKKEVLVDGRFYDVTNMKHPGGSIINFYAGKDIDATEAFANFHVRSKKAKKIMDHLPSRAAGENEKKEKIKGQSALMKDFDELTRDLEAEGFFKPDIPHVIFRIAELLAMFVVGFYLLLNGQIILGLLIAGVAQGRCGWFMHEGGHYSLTGHIPTDRLLQIFFYGTGCGMSGSWWRNQHNKHHATPQKIGHDVDLETLPLVAFTDKVMHKLSGGTMKRWISYQAILFPIITTSLVALGWQLFVHPRHILRTKQYTELGFIGLRYALWTYMVTMKYGLLQSTGLYLAFMWVAANYIFLNFAVSHTHLDTVAKDDDKVDWVRYSAVYTMNVSPGPFKFISWWMSYLNFQIEHHLFPSMPQFRHPIVSPRVKALFEKHGLKYDQRSYSKAMYDTFRNLHNVGNDVFLG